MHGICPWFLTHSHIRFFGPFWREWGYVEINSHLTCIDGEININVLDQFWWNLVVNAKMEAIMV